MKTTHLTKAQYFALDKLQGFGPSVLSYVSAATKAVLLRRGFITHLNNNPHWFMLTDAGRAVLKESAVG